MWAVTIEHEGSPATLGWAEVQDPVPGPGEVLIEVAASAVNRADLLQAAGLYPVPPGASPILGMECSGTITGLGPGVIGWQLGDQVCALLAGGGYAQRVTVPAVQVLPVPAGVDLVTAAALPEAACTVWSNLVMTADLRARQIVLIQGGGSGIGTMAIQVARQEGATVAVTASRAKTLDFCRELGAKITIDYSRQDFVQQLLDATDGHGADIILDVIGAKYLQRNVSALADGGRLVIIGMQGGTKAELDIGSLLRKRAGIIGTTLRSRPTSGPGSKAKIVAEVRERLWPMISSGEVRPVVDSVMELPDAARAHARLEAGGHIGKIVLRAPDTPGSAAGGARSSPAIRHPAARSTATRSTATHSTATQSTGEK